MNAEFVDAMSAADIDPGETQIIADGRIRRFRGPGDKPGHKNCWYVLFDHGGAFGSWRLGLSENWFSGDSKLSRAERRCLEVQIKAGQAQAEAERKRLQAAATKRARQIWSMAVVISDVSEHEYLLSKNAQPHGARRYSNALCLPLYDQSDELVSLQFISPSGKKTFLRDGRVYGCYYRLADQVLSGVRRLAIAEGFATAASIYQATNIPVAVAFNACNLLPVAKSVRKKYRNAEIVLCADDDRGTEGNPGITKAREAARQVDGRLAIPAFAPNVNGKDFNDLASEAGLDAVRHQILAAIDLGIPANFKLTKEGLYLLRERKTECGALEIDETLVCSPLEVTALTRDSSGGEWGRLLRFADPDGRAHEWAMPTEMLAGDGTEYRRRPLEQGLTIQPGNNARYALHEYVSQCRPAARCRAVTRVGWHEKVFVLPDVVFGNTQGERTLYQSSVPIAHAFTIRGSLEDWQREVAARCAGNLRLLFAVSVAFAAGLLYLTNDESGGFHFVGHSSIGKTTALRVDGSIWGGCPAQHGYLRQWRATANGLEGIAALHCDALLCLDELSEVGAREAGNIAYMLANGMGKSRARRDGSARPAYEWRLMFLSSGELTLADKVNEDNRQRVTAGQQIRVLDIPADAEAGNGLFEEIHGAADPREFADHLRAATQSCYGTPARASLTAVTKQPDKVADAVRKYRDDFIQRHCPGDADGQVRRAAARFGLVAAAGELASALGITGWPGDAAARAAGVCFGAWLQRRGHAGQAEIEAGIEQIRKFIALHGESRFSKAGISEADGKHPVVYERAGFRKEGNYCVYPEVFRSEVVKGIDWHLLAGELLRRNMLVGGENGKPQRKVRDPETGKSIRMFCLTPAILGIETDAGQDTGEAEAAQ